MSGGVDACWPWLAYRDPNGYGEIGVNGKSHGAHRIAFFLTNGVMPSHFVCHACDNPPCCNPRHLFDGDQKSNMQDMLQKNRGAHGSRNGHAKLTESQVQDILHALEKLPRYTHRRHKTLAELYNVSLTTIKKIGRRTIWRHITTTNQSFES